MNMKTKKKRTDAVIAKELSRENTNLRNLLGNLLRAVTSKFDVDTRDPIAWSGSPNQNRNMRKAIDETRKFLCQ